MEFDPTPAAELVAKCVSAFGACLASIETSHIDPSPPRDLGRATAPSSIKTPTQPRKKQTQPAEYHWVENRLADFNLWTDGVGALGKDGASLDSRFASRPHNLAPVKTILTLLISSVVEFTRSLQFGQPSQEARDGINSCLDNLALVGVAIRLTGRKSRLQKYDGRFDSSKFNELRRFLEILCSRRPVDPANTDEGLSNNVTAEDRIRRLQSPTLTAAQRRLIEANLRRRNRFMQSYNHSKGLQSSQPLLPSRFGGNIHDASHAQTIETPENTPIGKIRTEKRPKSRGFDAPSIPDTLASAPEGSIYLGTNPARDPAAPRRAATVLTALTGAATYPKPPRITEDMKLFKCPSCFQAFPVELGKSKERWKKHLSEDVAPYTCILEDCPSPFTFYITSKDWEQHVKNEHSPRWECALCESSSKIFTRMGAFLQHIQHDHAEVASEDMTAFLLSSCTTITIGVTRCPLCDSSGPESDPEFIQHVLSCIQDFSLTSLPWSLQVESCRPTLAFDLDYLRKRCDANCLHSVLESNPAGEGLNTTVMYCPSILPWLYSIPEDQMESTDCSNNEILFIELCGIDPLDEWVPPDVYFHVEFDDGSNEALDRSSRSFDVHEDKNLGSITGSHASSIDSHASSIDSGSSRKCELVGCDRKHVYDTIRGARIYSSYCQEHTCQAPRNENTPFCINPRDASNRYCHAHLCTIAPNCPNPAVLGAGHCNVHVPCGLVRGCRRQRMRFRDGRQAIHCDMHIPCAKSEQGCRQIAASRSDFCFAHKCSLEGCVDGKESSSHYCKQHTCHSSGCHQAKFDIHSRSAKYCSAHECSVDKCLHEAKTAGGFCSAHSCAHGSCNAGQLSKSPYCREHCCHHDKCSHEALHRNGFCRSHSCIEKGCKEPRLGGRDHIRQCLGHWTRDIRENVASEVGHRAERERLQLEEEIHDLEYRERRRLLADMEERRLAEEEAQYAKQVKQAKAEIERKRLAEHLAKVDEERRRHEADARFEEEIAARLAAEDVRQDHKAGEAQRAERERLQREERIARAAADRERARIAQEDADARRRASADQRFADDLRRERIAREQIEEERRREEEELRRLRDQGRFG